MACPKREAEKPAGRVRVIVGSLRGRRLVVPTGDHVRPTKDIVREAVFSALDGAGDRDAVVLDIYSGSGARWRSRRSRGAEPNLCRPRGAGPGPA